MIRQEFKPDRGKIAVMREAETALVKRARAAGIEVSDETLHYEKRANPWAFVVGVGEPRVTEHGTTITTDVQAGDRVIIAEVGKNVPLTTADGQIDFVYVIPFEGVMGILQWRCTAEGCTYLSRTEPEDGECPVCPKLATPTMQELKLVEMSKEKR